MKIKRTADAPGCMYTQGANSYKVGTHGKTYRWAGDEWVRSSCTLERLPRGGWVLRQPRPAPRVYSDFALPTPQMTQR